MGYGPTFHEAAGALNYESASRYRLFECSELVSRSAAKGAINVMTSADKMDEIKGKVDQVLEEAGPLVDKVLEKAESLAEGANEKAELIVEKVKDKAEPLKEKARDSRS